LLISWHGHSLWHLVYRLVPGGTAIRAASRFQLVLFLSIVLVSVLGVDALLSHISSPALRFGVFGVLASLFILEQIQTGVDQFDAAAESALLSRIQPAPRYCSHFVLAPEPSRLRRGYEANLDAVLLAERSGIPTLNGYSGDVPRTWQLFDPSNPTYVAAATAWIQRNNLQNGLCIVAIQNGVWLRAIPEDPSKLIGRNLIDFAPASIEEGLSVALDGFYDLEPGGRWTDGLGAVVFSSPVGASELRIDGSWNRTRSPVRVFVNGRLQFSQAVPNGAFSVTLPVSEPIHSIQIDSGTFVPALIEKSSDSRQLGVVIKSIELR
jgi:hypothetical protein